ncbi:hypothetical protein [Chitinophaga sp. 212800010-3]|uniref:hypothetical protein n=1 Tax=unclassified Chitinophaga TaxID=2619133 RepID=UPI002DE8567F|nr:hypothetical protein [Chitinophaga sp. 212800010-3]
MITIMYYILLLKTYIQAALKYMPSPVTVLFNLAIIVSKGTPSRAGKFVTLWQQTPAGWKITRVISLH